MHVTLGVAMLRSFHLACLLALVVPMAAMEPITLLSEESPPLNMTRAGVFTGPSVDLVKELCRRVGQPADISVLPWSRAYRQAIERSHTGLFSTTRNPEREPLFHWIGPLARERWVLFRRPGGPHLTTLDDARRVATLAVVQDDAKEQHMRTAGFTNLARIARNELCLRMLMAGNADLWLCGDIEAYDLADSAHIARDTLEVALVLPEVVDNFLAISASTPAMVVTPWRDAWAAMTADGSVERITRAWIHAP